MCLWQPSNYTHETIIKKSAISPLKKSSLILTLEHFQNIQIWISFQNSKGKQKCNDTERET